MTTLVLATLSMIESPGSAKEGASVRTGEHVRRCCNLLMSSAAFSRYELDLCWFLDSNERMRSALKKKVRQKLQT